MCPTGTIKKLEMHGCNFWGQSSGLLGFCVFSFFFFCTLTSFSGYVNHIVQSIWLCHFWISYTWCFYETVAALAKVVVSTLQRLLMKPGLAALCITYLPKHPQGQLRAEFSGTRLRAKPQVMLHTSVRTTARPSFTACARPRLVSYFICPLCHVTYLRWAKRPAGTKGFCFVPWGQCEQGKQVLGKLLPSKYCWFWKPGHMSAYHILKILEGNSLDWCCYCKVTLIWLAQKPGSTLFFFFLDKLTKEGKKRCSNYSMHVSSAFSQATSVFTIAVHHHASLHFAVQNLCHLQITNNSHTQLNFIPPAPSNTPAVLCGTTSECGKVGCLWILNHIFPMRQQKRC